MAKGSDAVMKTIDVTQLTELSRKAMIKSILDKRDEVIRIGNKEAQSFIRDWQSSAPNKTGFTRKALSLQHNPPKYTTKVVVADYRPNGFPEPFLINILNKRTRFKIRLVNKYKRSFYKKFNNK